MFRLRIVPDEGPSFEQPLPQGVVRVGRADDCELRLDDPFLSRYHARLRVESETLFVEDLDSANGTYVNGEKLAAAHELRVGDVIRVSDTRIELLEEQLEGEQQSASTPGADAGLTMVRSMDEVLAEVRKGSGATSEQARLQQQADRLRLLNDIHQALSRPIELESLLDLVLDGAFQHLHPERAVIYLRDAKGGVGVAAAKPETGETQERPISQTLIGEVMDKGQAAIAFDVQSDDRFSAAGSMLAAGAQSIIAAPLQDADECVGMLVLSSSAAERAFEEEDIPLLVSLASAAAMRIRNLALAEEAAERERLEGELAMARRIQESLLPDEFPEPPGLEIYGVNSASRWVSGDYFQVVKRADEELVMAIADVCGKGMAAALLAATLEAAWSTLIDSGSPPEVICSRASQFLYDRTPPDRFATAFLATVNADEGRLRYVNAGHNPPLLLRATGELEELEATGFPLGMVPECEYEVGELDLEDGDLLICFTDGIVEAMNSDREQYQLDRLAELCLRMRDCPLPEITAKVERELEEFSGGVPFADDRTLLLLRRESTTDKAAD